MPISLPINNIKFSSIVWLVLVEVSLLSRHGIDNNDVLLLLLLLGTTIVCAYLLRYMNMTLRDAYLLCKKHRPICFPNLGFWNQLIAYENQLRQENSVKSKVEKY